MELDKRDTVRDIQDLLAVSQALERLETLGADKDALLPKLDLLDAGDSFEVVIEVPGVSQENLEVALQGRSLMVAGIRDAPASGGKALLAERPRGPFQRSLELPADVDEGGVRAQLYEGLLVLRLPKRSAAG